MTYSHKTIDSKWQKKWEKDACFEVKLDKNQKKYYILDMFPYPSGSGLHMGHLASYTPSDIVARLKRSQGFNVLHPIGYDSFGLPAEQYAIQTGIHPEKTTKKAIDNFRRQLKSFGYSFSWSREVSTCDSSFYKWTQYIFKILFKKGLAYQIEAPVNWCPNLKTVLANEEVVDGKSERGGHPVVQKQMKQWKLKITNYADDLLQGLDEIDWPERTKISQQSWIGRSEGVLIDFPIQGHKQNLKVFTTRADTLFGVTYMVLAPEYDLISKITTEEQKEEVVNYQKQCKRKTELDRKLQKEKTGVFTGAFALHPITKKTIPIWIADYVFKDYGTGAVMSVPAHDERDFEFAKKFDLPIKEIIESNDLPFTEDGIHIYSSAEGISLDGLNNKSATKKMIDYLEENQIGKKEITYKLRDWLFSRQRYWGEPFPILHTKDGIELVADKNLPIKLPEVANYEPSEKGESPLARIDDFLNCKDAKGRKAVRETDTMPGSAASSWYFLRYLDPKNDKNIFDFEKQNYWMPVDLYIGGAEHSVGHLLYSRFFQRVLYNSKLVSHKEPFKKLAHQGVILGEDGYRMSKSRGNGVSPDDLVKEYGADAIRLHICFLGPFDKDKVWSLNGIEGINRFLDKVWKLSQDSKNKNESLNNDLDKTLHCTIKKVQEDIETLNFNTAISSLMILANEIYKSNIKNEDVMKIFVQLLMPFAPHISEEMWELLGEKSIVSLHPWPKYDPDKVKTDLVSIGVQINGKTRGSIDLSISDTEEVAVQKAMEVSSVKKFISEKKIIKVIYRSGKILNLIVK